MSSNAALIVEGLLSLGLRVAFFLSCRGYVQKILFADLREVISEDYQLEPVSPGGRQTGSVWRKSSQTEINLLPIHADSPPSTPKRNRSIVAARSSSSSRHTLYSRLSSLIFCLTFSESCILFTLVLFGNMVNERQVFVVLLDVTFSDCCH